MTRTSLFIGLSLLLFLSSTIIVIYLSIKTPNSYLDSCVKSKDVLRVVQVGAHTGSDWLNRMLTKRRDQSSICLIEPNTDLHAKLHMWYRNVNHSIHSCLIGDENKASETFYISNNSTRSSILKSNVLDVQTTIMCEVYELNYFLTTKYEYDRVDILLIDTEGYDYTILSSWLSNPISIRPYTIIFENLHTDGHRKRGKNYVKLLELFKTHGYEVYKEYLLGILNNWDTVMIDRQIADCNSHCK